MSVRHAPDPRYPGRPWLAEVYTDGRRTRRRARTRREAESIARALHGQRLPQHGLEAALLEYLTTVVPRLTKPADPTSHARILRPYLAGRGFDDVPEVVRELTRDHARLSNATLNRRLALLRRLGRLAVEWGWIPTAPRVRLLPERSRDQFLTREQVEALAARMPRAGDVVRLMAYTGLRVTEALRLTPEHVIDHGLAVETLKQRQRAVRWVPVPERIGHILAALPFTASRQILRTEWEAARAAEGLPGVRLHDLRHTYASWLAARKASDAELAALLGHTDRRIVARYAHLRSGHLAKTVRKL